MREVQCVWAVEAQLGEGPFWSSLESALWFVDIKGQWIHRFEPATAEKRSWHAPDRVGFVLPQADGSLAAGLPGRLVRFEPATAAFETLVTLQDEPPGNRLNDACVDSVGRIWFGSMDDDEAQPLGVLYCWDGTAAPLAVDRGFVISNGPALSPDGRTLYHTDTVRRTIYQFDVALNGAVSGKRSFIQIEENVGWPDGTTIDAQGCLWVGLYGGWAARRYSPRGELLEVVRFPCANVTKLALGGIDLRKAYVTTARGGLNPEQLAAQPLAGGLFTFTTDVPGCNNDRGGSSSGGNRQWTTSSG
jgi:D-xylonolactonase